MKVEHPEEPRPEGEEEEKHPPCPTCREEWDGKAVYCFWCGYEEKDEDNPAHPMPDLVEGVADPAELLSDEQKTGIREIIAGISGRRKVIFTTFRTPDEYSPAGMAHALFNNWAVGDKKADSGVLVMWDPDRNRVEIATGRDFKAGGGSLKDAAVCFAASIAEGDLVRGFRTLTQSL